MCKYCEKHFVEKYGEYEVENLTERIKSKNNRGHYTGIQTFINPDTNELVIVACLDNEYIKPILDYKHIPINYCPVCGRKIEKIK